MGDNVCWVFSTNVLGEGESWGRSQTFVVGVVGGNIRVKVDVEGMDSSMQAR